MSRYMPEGWVLPKIDQFNSDFFSSGRLVLQECSSCGNVQHPPEQICHRCHGSDFRGREVDGHGTVYSYVVVHNPPLLLTEKVPYGVVLVSLDELPEIRIIGNLLGVSVSDISIGLRVRATFEQIDDPDGGIILLPQWELVDKPAE